MTDVFISYSQADRQTAKRLADVLRESDLSIWMDEQSLAPGADIATELEQAIKNSRTVLVLLGSKTDSNSWVRTEAAIALSQKDKRVVPILTTKNADIPFILRHLQAVDLADTKAFHETAKELAQYLKHSPAASASDPSARFAVVAAESDALRLEKLSYDRAKTNRNTSLIASAAAALALSIGIVVLLIHFKDEPDLSYRLISMLFGVVAGAVASCLYGPLKNRIRSKLAKRAGGEA